MTQTVRDAQKWIADIKVISKVLHVKIHEIKSLYGKDPVTPEESEILESFALCLNDIGRYCADNYINAKSADAVKLMAFAIPYLLSVRSYALNLNMYVHACLLVIHGKQSSLDYKMVVDTANVSKHLCLKYPPQHMVVYGYLKGYQESLEINNPL